MGVFRSNNRFSRYREKAKNLKISVKKVGNRMRG
jgi:hypothetical protein